MKRDAVYSILCALSLSAGLPALAWLDLSALEWSAAVRRGRQLARRTLH